MHNNLELLESQLAHFKATLKHYDNVEYELALDLDEVRKNLEDCQKEIRRLEDEIGRLQDVGRRHSKSGT